jgi:hypothetical protein
MMGSTWEGAWGEDGNILFREKARDRTKDHDVWYVWYV